VCLVVDPDTAALVRAADLHSDFAISQASGCEKALCFIALRNVASWPGAAFVARTYLVANGGKADAAGSRENDAIDPELPITA
jgi:hypothetical protein